jgi:uncharacterized protein
MTTEKRCIDFDQSRMQVEKIGEAFHLRGYAVVEYRADDPKTQFRMGPRLVERVKRSAIDAILAKKDDIIGAFNHDPHFVLGRRSNGTLSLSADQIGLKYDIELPDTTYARDLLVLVARGDVKGSSFMGSMEFDREVEGDQVVRWVRSIDPIELGPVTAPAYEATTAHMRSIGDAIEHERRDELRRKALELDAKIIDLTLSRR